MIYFLEKNYNILKNKCIIICFIVFFGLALQVTYLTAQENNLPDMGSPADAVLSKTEEAKIGRAIMQQIRASGTFVEDPQVNEYINEIGHRLSAQANSGEYKFSFFVINDNSINAFALPGGYIGVHTGLLLATRNEDELASVLAHEIAHVTQRHIARAVHAGQRQSILSTAIMLGAIIAGAAGAGSDAVQGAMAVAQGAQAQQQINFTRANEYEADRIGISALAQAGFNPHGMASFFEVISKKTALSASKIPEFLKTHPITSARISEARNRAKAYSNRMPQDTHNYGITKSRLLVSSQRTIEDAIDLFETQNYQNQSDEKKYGRALAYQRAGQHKKANQIFEELLNRDHKIIAYHIGLAESQLNLELINEAKDTFDRAMELFPRNIPLVIHYAEALLRLNNALLAHEILLDLLNNIPPTPEQVRLISRAAIEAENPAEAHYYMAEYRFMIGDLMGGVNFLQRALALPNIEEIQRIRFEARIDFVKEFMSKDQLKQMGRNNPSKDRS